MPHEERFLGALPADFKLPACGTRTVLRPTKGAGSSAAIASLIEKAQLDKRLLTIVCADASEALRLTDELAWLVPEAKIALLPDWETLPYDTTSPHEALVSERLETLWKLANDKDCSLLDVLIVSACCAAFHFAPREFVATNTFFYKKGQKVNLEELKSLLVESGYSRVDQVYAAGEFSVRGSLIDIFPMGERHPFRLDLFDNEIDSIRVFDPDTQRSDKEASEIRILPGHEFPMDEESLNFFRENWRKTFEGDPTRSSVYTDTTKGLAAPGIEYYLPLFFYETSLLADYLPENAIVLTSGDVDAAISAFYKETEERYEFLRHDNERPALNPKEFLLPAPSFFSSLGTFSRIRLENSASTLPDLSIERRAQKPLAKLESFIDTALKENRRLLICAQGEGRLSRIEELLEINFHQTTHVDSFNEFFHSQAPLCLAQAPLTAGFSLDEPLCAVITETEIYLLRATARKSRLKRTAANLESTIRDLRELAPGDPVVHAEHGVGRYVGLETIESAEGKMEFLRIDYAAGAKLFVPVSQLHLIARYTGRNTEDAPLNSLGRGDWDKTKRKAALKAHDTAAELLDLYAKREARAGCSFTLKGADYEAFAEGFEFEETPDQARAIADVLSDMTKGRPMDRLVCGDVGFGKTEIALRAAFVAVMNGKQVAVLCPTTLLAEQHARTFADRFAAWPVSVRELSRFRAGAEMRETLAGLADGRIDIVIGTHKLLSETIQFKNLGLVVVDEEHRFGVRQKERLKALRAEVDILTLTATPIPRTLAMSLEGIRDYSVITTAPEKRLSIKTFVRQESNDLIRQAILRELKRGGQVYFLHNDVDTIQARLERLKALVPEARFGLAHGQMPERELEAAMHDFYQQRTNVLLCSTIIENGIDIANANTIIMHRADRLGLAQLHQLRGRVGRSHHQAYAYLLIPSQDALTGSAKKRLEAIERLEDLGSGFNLAMYDLEIRGAGEILGEEQSGEISKVGFELYTEMLKDAVDALKEGKTPSLEHPFGALTEINLHMSALLPEDYVPDVGNRLMFYKKLALAKDPTEIEAIVDSLADRYGKMPEATQALIAVHRLRLRSRKLGIRKIDASEKAVLFTFEERPKFSAIALVKLMQSRRDMRLIGPDKLRLTAQSHNLVERLRVIALLVDPLLADAESKSDVASREIAHS